MIKTEKLIQLSLKELIENITVFSNLYDVYLLKNPEFKKDESCLLVLEGNENYDTKKFQYAFGLYIVEDVVENLKLQKVDYSIEEALEAIKFYFENDAFIEVKS